MKKPLLIYGAGGLGREILSLVNALDEWEAVGFVDDSFAKGEIVSGLKVLGSFTDMVQNSDTHHLVIAIGNPIVKENLALKMQQTKFVFPILRHPSAIVQSEASIRLGDGTIICAGCILTTNISVGKHVLINLNTTIGHDCSIGDFSSLMPGVNVSGDVNIGNNALIGAGANIINRITIGDNAIIGMGSVVIRSVSPNKTVVGVPAKELK
jgi:sugar O-acyltransferase (sialic acid O-acetyltransferase NeuD family)